MLTKFLNETMAYTLRNDAIVLESDVSPKPPLIFEEFPISILLK